MERSKATNFQCVQTVANECIKEPSQRTRGQFQKKKKKRVSIGIKYVCSALATASPNGG